MVWLGETNADVQGILRYCFCDLWNMDGREHYRGTHPDTHGLSGLYELGLGVRGRKRVRITKTEGKSRTYVCTEAVRGNTVKNGRDAFLLVIMMELRRRIALCPRRLLK